MSRVNKKGEGIPLHQNETVEETLERVKKEREKSTKRSKRIKVIIGIAAAALVLLILLIVLIIAIVSKNMPTTVPTVTAQKGLLEANVTVTGVLESGRNVNYYAPESIVVGEVVETGTVVSKGDTLLVFDEEDYAAVLKEYELEHKIATNEQKSTLQTYNENKADLATAKANVSKYQKLKDAQQNTVNHLTATITDANAIRAAEIEKEIYECERKIREFQYYVDNAEELGMGKEGVETYLKYIRSESERISELNFELSQLSGSVQAIEQQKALSDAQKLLADYEGELESAKAEKESLEKIIGNEYDEENILLSNELSAIRAEKSYQSVLACKDGLKADVAGVVSAVSVVPGDKSVAGTTMITVSSLEEVVINFTISKNELDDLKVGQKAEVSCMDSIYEGTVTHVGSMAVATGNNGALAISAQVRIDNPDENLCLGLTAKVNINTATKDDALMIPLETLYTDAEGDFIYIVENGIVVKRYVTVGIESATHIEILDGIEEGTSVMTSLTVGVEEGSAVIAMPDVTQMMLQMENMEALPEEVQEAESTEAGSESDGSDEATENAEEASSEKSQE